MSEFSTKIAEYVKQTLWKSIEYKWVKNWLLWVRVKINGLSQLSSEMINIYFGRLSYIAENWDWYEQQIPENEQTSISHE